MSKASQDKSQDALGEDQPKEAGADEVQAAVDEETEKGYRGEQQDPTPNEHYTVAGVVAGKPVPEVEKFKDQSSN